MCDQHNLLSNDDSMSILKEIIIMIPPTSFLSSDHNSEFENISGYQWKIPTFSVISPRELSAYLQNYGI